MMNNKIIVAHPDKQHSIMTAIALQNYEMLHTYITTVYDKPNSITNKIKSFLTGVEKKKAESRKNSKLNNDNVVQFGELFKLILLFLGRLKIRMPRIVKYFFEDYFGKKVAKYAIDNKASAVIMYDTTALACFKFLKKNNSNIICILETTTLSHDYMRNVFDRNISIYKSQQIKKDYPYLWNEKFQERCLEEFKYTDYFFAPSSIVEESLRYSGVGSKKIIKVPYGVDVNSFAPKQKYIISHELRLLFVGSVNCRKGVDKILEAVDEIGDGISIDIVGEYDQTSDWFKKYGQKKNVNFLGFVPRDVIVTKFQESDIFVLASLAEGMALVGLEAMGCGLPVICSQYTGVNDLIINGENGFVFDVFNKNELRNILCACIKHKDEIERMGKKARTVAMHYSWDEYGKKLSTQIANICSIECHE